MGDLIAQTFFNPDGNGWDVVRTLKFTFLGAALVGPGLHYWYGFLNRLIPSQTVAGTISRVAVDQFVWAPVFISAFLSSLLTLSGEMSSVPSKLKNDLWATCKANWLIWIPFQVVNFGVIPPNLQVAAALPVSQRINQACTNSSPIACQAKRGVAQPRANQA